MEGCKVTERTGLRDTERNSLRRPSTPSEAIERLREVIRQLPGAGARGGAGVRTVARLRDEADELLRIIKVTPLAGLVKREETR